VRLIDSHCHLNYEGLVERQGEVLQSARERGVAGFLNISTRQREWTDIISVAEREPDVWASVGVHPHEADAHPDLGAAVILAKVAAGCVIPWHWHTAGEQLMFVAGSAKVDMKDGAPVRMHTGDYIKLPAKNVHQFTCVAACTFYLATDGAFDIHYVDKDGKEISMDEALKAKAPAKKAPAKSDMKDMKM